MKLPARLLDRLKARADRVMSRSPSKVIGEQYLTRWHIIPKNPLFNVYLHHIEGSDPDTHLHDHPWRNTQRVIRTVVKERLGWTRQSVWTGKSTRATRVLQGACRCGTQHQAQSQGSGCSASCTADHRRSRSKQYRCRDSASSSHRPAPAAPTTE